MPAPDGSSPAKYIALTGNTQIDGMLSGVQWISGITYSFVGPDSVFVSSYNDPTFVRSVQAFSAAQQAAVNSMVAQLGNFTGLTLKLVTESATQVGDVRLGFSVSHAFATNLPSDGFTPGTQPAGGDEWLNPMANDAYLGTLIRGGLGASDFRPGSYGNYMALANLLFALGEKVPDYAYTPPLNPLQVPAKYVGFEYTVMANTRSAVHADVVGLTYYPTTPMLLDIQALQSMYGTRLGNTGGDNTYAFNDNKDQYYNQTIWDGGGINTISYSGSTASSIDLRAGHGSFIGNKVYGYTVTEQLYETPNVWIANGTDVRVATVTGSAAVSFQANDTGNWLTGGSGNDSFAGGAGRDVMRGNAGNDVINGGGGADTAIFNGNLADYTLKFGATAADPVTLTDTRKAVGNDGVDTLTSIERLQFADVGIAYDMAATDVAGKTALVMGATLGAWFTQDKGWAGTFLKFFDGGATVLQGTTLLVSAGIVSAFAGGADNASFVRFVYNNVYGQAPDAATLAALVAPLDAHTTTQAQWMADIALSATNQQHVNLVGLAASGWQYTPTP